LTRDPPFSRLDLIVCRNVLIYLGQPVQNRLMGVLHYALKTGGYLMLGSAESIGPQTDLFQVVDKKLRVYQKSLADSYGEMRFSPPQPRTAAAAMPALRGEKHGVGSALNEANRLILDRYAPPGVIVTEDLRIVQFRGHTGRFLEPAPGDASLNLLKMCREGLLHGLRTSIQGAKQRDAPVRREGLKLQTDDQTYDVAVEVVPLTATDEGRHYLILFQERPPAKAPPLRVHKPKSRKRGAWVDEEEVERLQNELIASREYLQSIIQDLEASNEELQSANEEILSSNEELQSTNEELDTAKEELQSTNEELNTLNEELHARNDELARTNSDLTNLLHGVNLAIVIVDNGLRIRRFTPVAERVLNLIPGDLGRPITHVKPNIDCPDLEQLVRQVAETASTMTREVRDLEGRTYTLAIRPYKDVDNRIDGAVLALFDTDEVRRHQRDAQAALAALSSVLDSLPQPVALLLPEDRRIQTANAAFCELFGLTRGDAQGKSLDQIAPGADLAAALKDVKERGLGQFRMSPTGSGPLRAELRPLQPTDSRPGLVALTIHKSAPPAAESAN
jgi:two-component system CheB/CheR fusion protein